MDELERLRQATLDALKYAHTPDAGSALQVVATIPGPRDELDEPMANSLGAHLAARVNRKIHEGAEGRGVAGVVSSKVGASYDADCEGPDGQVSAFQADGRCFRIVLQLALET